MTTETTSFDAAEYLGDARAKKSLSKMPSRATIPLHRPCTWHHRPCTGHDPAFQRHRHYQRGALQSLEQKWRSAPKHTDECTFSAWREGQRRYGLTTPNDLIMDKVDTFIAAKDPRAR